MGGIFKAKSRQKYVSANLPVWVQLNGKVEQFWTSEISVWGLRMYMPSKYAVENMTGRRLKLELSIELHPDEAPAQLVGDFLWSVRKKRGQLIGCLLFQGYYQDARERLLDFVQESKREFDRQSD